MATGGGSGDLHGLTLTGLAAALAAGEVSAVEATEHARRRIEALDGPGGLNAFVAVTAAAALAEAGAADARRAAGEGRGPLDGVPIALKDLFDTAGVRTTAASRLWRDRVPTVDAAVVRRLRAAGAVLL